MDKVFILNWKCVMICCKNKNKSIKKRYLLIIIWIYLLVGPSRRQQCFLKTHPISEPDRCDRVSRYRTISGRCNNFNVSNFILSATAFYSFLLPLFALCSNWSFTWSHNVYTQLLALNNNKVLITINYVC